MKASARNRFNGLVAGVKEGSVNDEIELLTDSGLRVVATVTRSSSEGLDLRRGVAAFALVKASSVVLVSDAVGVRFSARNQFQGMVSRVVRGAVNCEVTIALLGNDAVVALVTNESADAMDLTVGASVVALFKASSVILGVPA